MSIETVRFGVVGVGGMGSHHVGYIDTIPHAKLTAVCDVHPDRLEKAKAKHPHVQSFERYADLLASGVVDAIIIATPHYQHPEIAIAAMDRGIHVLSEKPAAVSVTEARRMNEAHARHPELTFGVMFQMRTSPWAQKLRQLVADGEVGEIARITWIVTDWFRTWSYYASGGWRATWKGEGGGVLLNQCPHNLDLLHWLFGGMMPSRVTAVATIGKTHPIEVEDEVSAILEYDTGAIGHFVTSTGEAPGTSRLEIAGDRGRLVAEGGKIKFSRTRTSVREFCQTSREGFARPETWEIDVPVRSDRGGDGQHKTITTNFVEAIRDGKPLIAPGEDGVKGLEIGNAMLMAGITRRPVELPIDGPAYDRFLSELAVKYGGRKTLGTTAPPKQEDLVAGFHT
jgi:predicted dehydrogenase